MAERALKDRFEEVRQRVREAAVRGGSNPDRVILVAVTKYAELDQIRELVELGHEDFGENKVQQLVQRAAVLEEYVHRRQVLTSSDRDGKQLVSPRWHMVGHLQRNKAKKAIEAVRLVHTVDSLRLAEELQSVALKREEPVDVLVQVNCSGEETKTGCPVPAAGALVSQIEEMSLVRVRGLMTMAPHTDDPETARTTFRRCRELFEEISPSMPSAERFSILSMGMSGDYEIALEEGANIVRIGSAIFGEPSAESIEASEGAASG